MKVKNVSRIALLMGVTVASAVVPSVTSSSAANVDFLKVDGQYVRDANGTGEVMNMRGTNLGGWLTFEDWMSPLGEFSLDRSTWAATASSGDSAGAVLDGSNDTRWTTGFAQSGGEWIEIDMGSGTLINRLHLDAGNYVADHPVDYEVFVSDDGESWSSVAAAPATDGLVKVRFTPQIVRHVRVVQNGRSNQWWSVAEINAFSDAVVNSGSWSATAAASASGHAPSDAIDGDIETRWESVAGTQPFEIDLGTNREIKSVLMDAGPDAPGTFPRAYDIWGSEDGVNWEKFSSGFGDNRITFSEFWTGRWMRYVRIVGHPGDTVGDPDSWSIAQVTVYSTDEFDKEGWMLTSSGSDAADTVADRDVWSRWTTAEPQQPGQWLSVDFGATTTFNHVDLRTAKNSAAAEDSPAGYRIEVSADGANWRTVASGAGNGQNTIVSFPPASARHLRVVQTGSSDRWWSVGELDVALYNDDYSLRLALDERFGRAQAQDIVDVHRDTWVQESDFDEIARLGFNTIRLPFGWSELMNLDGSWKADPWSKIDWAIEEAGQRGLYVILDLHTVPGGGCPWGSCGRRGPNPNEFWLSTEYQDWVVEIWSAIAERYVGNATIASYDLMNEPLVDYDEDADDVALKSDVYDRIYRAVRAEDPDHIIQIAAFFGWDNIAKPADYGWDNVMYQIHPYDMPNGQDWDAQNRLVTEQLASVAQKLDDPDWGVPVLYGEYSFYHYDDVWATFMSGMNDLDVSWTNWTYKVRGANDTGAGGYWGLFNSNSEPIPVINSDDAATFAAKLSAFGTEQFVPNGPFMATVAKFSGGQTAFDPVAVDRAGWTATASVAAADSAPGNAFDANSATRWSTGEAQQPGQWFEVDMGQVHPISQITVETGPNDRWDHMRSFELLVSVDGTEWTTVGAGPGFGWKRPITFPNQDVRHVRIIQTGSAPEWWSISSIAAYRWNTP